MGPGGIGGPQLPPNNVTPIVCGLKTNNMGKDKGRLPEEPESPPGSSSGEGVEKGGRC